MPASAGKIHFPSLNHWQPLLVNGEEPEAPTPGPAKNEQSSPWTSIDAAERGCKMSGRRNFLMCLAVMGAGTATSGTSYVLGKTSGSEDRAYWVSVLKRLAEPVLMLLAERRLKQMMPIESAPGHEAERREFSHLEALGRLLDGIAPWLELGQSSDEEGQLRGWLADLARKAIAAATDPDSPDYLNFSEDSQPLVDAAFLAQALLRAPVQLWARLDAPTRSNVLTALKTTRSIQPSFNNWLLFSAMIEVALCQLGAKWDAMRVDYALRQHDQWYKGDGIYGDGAQLHWDYYNSFVIHPMLLDIIRVVHRVTPAWESLYPKARNRARRYAVILERLISPEGTFPAIGRSLGYRFGAFHLLGQLALFEDLPESLKPAQVRCALSAVIRRMMDAPGTFDSRGWLTIGFCGHQPGLGETYISTGSLYLCSVGLLPLGLPHDNAFWNDPPELWTSRRIWDGQDLQTDHALAD